MARFGNVQSKNHGYGKNMAYGGRQAIQDRLGGGHHGSLRTQWDRWSDFSRWARESLGIKDARRLARDDIQAYGRDLVSRGYATSTVQNRLSTVNTTLAYMRGDDALRVSPAEIAGKRSNVRETAPATHDRSVHERAVSALERAGHERAAAVLDLARELGLREREAIRADLSRLAREARRYGEVNIIDGTKGGRTAPRWVPVSPPVQAALERARAASPVGSRNLIAPHEKYTDARAVVDSARGVMRESGIPGYHDARAAYAADRYQAITGAPAPVIAGERVAAKARDREARDQVSHELGHGRRDVASSYLGSAR